MTEKGVIVLAAGGTGGHLFPAQALAEELAQRGYDIHLMTDERVKDYGKTFPAREIHEVPSATLSFSKPWLLPSQLLRLSRGSRLARQTFYVVKPQVVVGFGGYPSFPPLIAAFVLKIPSIIHDQNAIMGRANRVLARFTTAVASSFPNLARLPASAAGKVTVTGNPVRAIALREKAAPYVAPAQDETFRLLVFGGSQGARFFAEFMPLALKAMPELERQKLEMTQQCRAEDLDQVKSAYAALGVKAELAPFFMDMPKRIAAAHLVVCRSGASTIAELGVIGRPAVMVPLPHSIDNDQLRNAESFAAAGAGWVKPQNDLNPDEFAALLVQLRYQRGKLESAARAALAHGRPEAAKLLADLVERLTKSGSS